MYYTFQTALKGFILAVRKVEDQHAAEGRTPSFARDVFHSMKELLYVGVVCRIRSRVSGRIDAGLSSQIFYFQSRIIGKNNLSRMFRDHLCLLQGIFEKNRSVFYDIGNVCKVIKRKNINAQVA